jgi:two-component system OmpR family response regulator
MPNNKPGAVVLLVEDEWLVLDLISEEFELAGWDVVAASSGEKAVQILGARHVDLVVTDIRPAGPVDGWEVATTARKINPSVPVIYATAQSVEASLRVPDSAFIQKPYAPSVVVETGDEMLALPRDAEKG